VGRVVGFYTDEQKRVRPITQRTGRRRAVEVAETRARQIKQQLSRVPEEYGYTPPSMVRFDPSKMPPIPGHRKVDPRFSWVVQDLWDQKVNGVRGLIDGRRRLVSGIVWYGRYGAGIDQYGQVYLFKKGRPEPVPLGDFMGWWEPDHEKYAGVTKSMWDKMSYADKAKAEAILQARLWAAKEYDEEWADFYRGEEADKIWWTPGLDPEKKAEKIAELGRREQAKCGTRVV